MLPFDDRKLIIALCDVLNVATLFIKLDKIRKESNGVCTETFNDFFNIMRQKRYTHNWYALAVDRR
jgi:hypothetical protein